jgi:uncharacterized membrane protein YdjX (TVP38/TMEM64 family)
MTTRSNTPSSQRGSKERLRPWIRSTKNQVGFETSSDSSFHFIGGLIMDKTNKKHISIALMVVVIGLGVYLCKSSGMFGNCTPHSIKNYICSFGILAPIIYIVMFTIVPLTLFPDAVLAVVGGMIFGLGLGTLYTIIGAVCGGTLSFFISRIFGRGLVEKLIKGKVEWFENGIEKRGFLFILTLRLIPLVPFDVISYGAGLSKIKYKDFALATSIGIVPGVLVYTNLGDKSGNLFSVEFLGAILILVLLMIFSYFMKKKISIKGLSNKVT